MKQYFTEVDIEDYAWKLGYKDKVMFMGSCFAENIGEIMTQLKFDVMVNPFGVIYNPMSVAKSLRALMDKKQYTEEDLFIQKGVVASYDFHSRYSATSVEEALVKMNRQVGDGHAFLKNADCLILTFGTAWVYDLKESGQLVANCHKVDSSNFHRYRLTPGEIVDEVRDLLTSLWKFNSNLKVLFSVSPIRHLKDGSKGNQVSKSTLILAVDRLVSGFGKTNCDYFPSYEIVMDELRDYRFYAPDLVHLSPVAIDHIWEKFKHCLIDAEAKDLMKKVQKLKKALAHRPFRKDVPEYRDFLTKNLDYIKQLTFKFPYLNIFEEESYLKEELRAVERT